MSWGVKANNICSRPGRKSWWADQGNPPRKIYGTRWGRSMRLLLTLPNPLPKAGNGWGRSMILWLTLPNSWSATPVAHCSVYPKCCRAWSLGNAALRSHRGYRPHIKSQWDLPQSHSGCKLVKLAQGNVSPGRSLHNLFFSKESLAKFLCLENPNSFLRGNTNQTQAHHRADGTCITNRVGCLCHFERKCWEDLCLGVYLQQDKHLQEIQDLEEMVVKCHVACEPTTQRTQKYRSQSDTRPTNTGH